MLYYKDDHKSGKNGKKELNATSKFGLYAIGAVLVLSALATIFVIVRFSSDVTNNGNVGTSSDASIVGPKEIVITESNGVGETKGNDDISLGDLAIDSSTVTFQILDKSDELKAKVYEKVKVSEEGMTCTIYWSNKEVTDSDFDVLLVAAGELYEKKLNKGLSDRRFNIVTNRPDSSDLEALGSSVYYYVDKDYDLHLMSKVKVKDLKEDVVETRAVEFVLYYMDKYLELR